MGFIKKKKKTLKQVRIGSGFYQKNPKSNQQSNNIELKRKRAKVGNRF